MTIGTIVTSPAYGIAAMLRFHKDNPVRFAMPFRPLPCLSRPHPDDRGIMR